MNMLGFGELAHLWCQEYFPAQVAHVHLEEPSGTTAPRHTFLNATHHTKRKLV